MLSPINLTRRAPAQPGSAASQSASAPSRDVTLQRPRSKSGSDDWRLRERNKGRSCAWTERLPRERG